MKIVICLTVKIRENDDDYCYSTCLVTSKFLLLLLLLFPALIMPMIIVQLEGLCGRSSKPRFVLTTSGGQRGTIWYHKHP